MLLREGETKETPIEEERGEAGEELCRPPRTQINNPARAPHEPRDVADQADRAGEAAGSKQRIHTSRTWQRMLLPSNHHLLVSVVVAAPEVA
jgi:hypothetical protein